MVGKDKGQRWGFHGIRTRFSGPTSATCLAGLPSLRQDVPRVTMHAEPELKAFSLSVALGLVPKTQLRHRD